MKADCYLSLILVSCILNLKKAKAMCTQEFFGFEEMFSLFLWMQPIKLGNKRTENTKRKFQYHHHHRSGVSCLKIL